MSFDLIKAAKNHGFDEAYLVPGLFVKNASDFGLYDLWQITPKAKSVLLLLKAHKPFKFFPKGVMSAHSHYPAYQQAYALHKSFIEKLNSMGLEAKSADMLPLKDYASAAGMTRLKNSLIYHEKYGSYFVLQAVAVETESEFAAELREDVCKDCTICIKACPTGAIGTDGRLDRSKCIRNHVPVSMFIDEKIRIAAKTGFIGCGICQSVCPLNSKIEAEMPPRKLTEALKIIGILDLKNDNQPLRQLQQLIGKNEVRPTRSIATACMIAGNTREKRYRPYLEEILTHYINPLARGYAAWALGRIGGSLRLLKKALEEEHNSDVKNEIISAINGK